LIARGFLNNHRKICRIDAVIETAGGEGFDYGLDDALDSARSSNSSDDI